MSLRSRLHTHDAALRAEIPNLVTAVWLAIFPVLAVLVATGVVIGTSQGTEIVESLSAAWVVTKILSIIAFCAFVVGTTLAAALALEDVNDRSPSFVFIPWWVLFAALFTGVPVLRAHIISLPFGLGILIATLLIPPFIIILYDWRLPPLGQWLGKSFVRRAATGLTIFGLLVFITVFLLPVAFPRTLGPVGIIYSGFAFWTLLWTILFIVLPRRYGLPSLTLPVAILVLIFAGFNDNHGLRVCQTFKYDDVASLTSDNRATTPFCSGGLARASQHPPPPLRFQDHVQKWLKHNCRPTDPLHPRLCPMIFVAAEGGGSRAAYWTASVLAHLNGQTPNDAFFHHIFAISGVSGGSLGAAAFVGAYLRNPPDRLDRDEKLKDFVGDDYLSPILAGIVFPETLQHFLPWAFAALDRAHPFEFSLEDSWRRFLGDDGFHDDMRAFWPPGTQDTGPALFLNATNVERGVPFVVSNVLPPPDTSPESYYAYDPDALYHIDYLPMSAAVHLSARFSYVNPPATLYSRPSTAAVTTRKPESAPHPEGFIEILPWGRLVDGGYYDNSGAATLRDVLTATKRAVDDWHVEDKSAIDPEYLVLVILNNPDLSGATDADVLGRSLSRSALLASTVPDRSRELPDPYLHTLHELASDDYLMDRPPWSSLADRNLIFPDRFQQMLDSSTTWRRHIADSDLLSPVDAFFQVRGGGALGERLTLANLAAQLDVASIQECYNRTYPNASGDPRAYVYGPAQRSKLLDFLRCVPDDDYAELPSCAVVTRGSQHQKILPFDAIVTLLHAKDPGVACRVPLASEELSFGQVEEERAATLSKSLWDRVKAALDRRPAASPGPEASYLTEQSRDLQEAFMAPALGWSLSTVSRHVLETDAALIRTPAPYEKDSFYSGSTTVARVNDYVAPAPCTLVMQELRLRCSASKKTPSP
jgi:predicted acylesterase/phospholipase RssA/uncharacterized membrane protein SirB2